MTKRILQYIMQKISAADYFIKFQCYTVLIEWDDTFFMIMFKWDLKKKIHNELILKWENNINSMKNLIKALIKIDDKLYKVVMNKSYKH